MSSLEDFQFSHRGCTSLVSLTAPEKIHPLSISNLNLHRTSYATGCSLPSGGQGRMSSHRACAPFALNRTPADAGSVRDHYPQPRRQKPLGGRSLVVVASAKKRRTHKAGIRCQVSGPRESQYEAIVICRFGKRPSIWSSRVTSWLDCSRRMRLSAWRAKSSERRSQSRRT